MSNYHLTMIGTGGCSDNRRNCSIQKCSCIVHGALQSPNLFAACFLNPMPRHIGHQGCNLFFYKSQFGVRSCEIQCARSKRTKLYDGFRTYLRTSLYIREGFDPFWWRHILTVGADNSLMIQFKFSNEYFERRTTFARCEDCNDLVSNLLLADGSVGNPYCSDDS